MGILEWATSPLGQTVPIHIAWFLIWVALIAGLVFLIVHAIYVRYFARNTEFAPTPSTAQTLNLPARIPRHSLTARLFHWIMAAAMFVLLFTAFLPKVGVQFNWVTYHWIAGTVLTISILFHIVHATFYLDFWSIWPDRSDLEDAKKRFQRFHGEIIGIAAKIRQISSGKQALSRRGDVERLGSDHHRNMYDVPRAHHLLSAQSLSFWRYDLGHDVRAPWTGRRRVDYSDHCSRLLCHSPRETAHHCVDDRGVHEPRVLFEGA